MNLLLAACVLAAVPNADFTTGEDAPDGWSLSGGRGRWVDRQVLEVTGTGSDSNYWRCDYRFSPGALYQFQMRARHTGGSGCVIAGPNFANRDYRVSKDWKWYGHVFRAPDKTEGSHLRLGQWHATGAVQFDQLRVVPAIPVHRCYGGADFDAAPDGQLLGEGESIRNGRYVFSGTFNHQATNYHRPLHGATAGFNSNRWCFGRDSHLTYRFRLRGHEFRSGKISFNVNYHLRGGCLAEVSRDRKQWRALARQEKLGTAEAELPADLLPAETLYLRLKSLPESSSFQVDRVEFQAKLSGAPPETTGETIFAAIQSTIGELAFESFTLKEDRRFGLTMLVARVRNNTQEPIDAELTTDAASSGGVPDILHGFRVLPGKSAIEEVPLLSFGGGKEKLVLALKPSGGAKCAKATLTYTIADYYRSDYGELLNVPTDTAIWWCSATRKIPRKHFPAQTGSEVRLAAARNDREAVQVVVRPKGNLKGLTAGAGVLSGPESATIPAENIRILRVAYHFVHHPTDRTGVRDLWPDALPPLAGPIDVPAGQNQPLWVLVHVPKDAKAGDYTGQLALGAEGFSAVVPIKLHVWDFALPETNHLETAFGLSAGEVFRYHRLKTEQDKRRVLDMYLQSFAEHRISPYDPTPLDPIRVKFLPEADPPRTEVDFSAFDKAMARAIEKFHFTNFRLRIEGMGGGSFHKRYPPKIGKFTEDTPQYRAMFASYAGQLEGHLREKGWLKMAYIYWFDEPAPRDYQFVADGMKRLKKYAPALQRMLTEEPGEGVLAGVVDIWCPVSYNYDHAAAQKRRACGQRFWWYVCCGPKAPYCTLFIDHPAVELRTWLWQTWQRDVRGVLVWRANYWTSSAAFPEKPQNPYEDPMGYTSGYSTPRGVKRYWGNGDGRFIYPPESAAVPGLSGPDPVIEPPVSSIRWEMLREGIEDYEYLHLLRELINKRRDRLTAGEILAYEQLLKVPQSITRDMTTFSTDPAAIYARRAAIAEAIERLSE